MHQFTEDKWLNDVTLMIVLWLIGTLIAGGLLLTVIKDAFL
jgi:hypothetical protein